jgi:hypothetical protein
MKFGEMFFGRKQEFVPDPEFEERVLKINDLVTKILVVAQRDWSYKEYPPEAKSEMELLQGQINTLADEGGGQFREYLRPWKGKKEREFKYEDLPRVRVANMVLKSE